MDCQRSKSCARQIKVAALCVRAESARIWLTSCANNCAKISKLGATLKKPLEIVLKARSTFQAKKRVDFFKKVSVTKTWGFLGVVGAEGLINLIVCTEKPIVAAL